MKKAVVIGCAVLMACAVGVGLASDNLKAAITGEVVGATATSWTNGTGAKIELTAVIASGTLDDATNSVIQVTQNSQTFDLARGAVSNTLTWISGSGGFNLERNGVITFTLSASSTQTNRYRIEGR